MASGGRSDLAPHGIVSGAALGVKQVSRICRRAFTPIIFMAGETKSGKTTLLASLHDAFLFGPLGDFQFAGSETLYAFEERAFESRAKSKGIEPKTPRTRYESGQEYFHLRLREQATGRYFEILFADMSGEFYERSLYSKSEVDEFKDLSRAQVLLLLLDGSNLAKPTTRQAVRANALQFIQRCTEQHLLQAPTKLQVLISKWDAVPAPTREACLEFIQTRFNAQTLGRQVDVLPVASRPGIGKKDEKLFGIRDLFPDWVKTVPEILRTSASDTFEEKAKTRASLNAFREVSA
jgi:Double-GTPase 2